MQDGKFSIRIIHTNIIVLNAERIINICLIFALPAELEWTVKRMCDLISRKMAIGAIEEMQMPIMRSKWESDQFKFSALAEVREMISELPSAQPDLDEWCTDCKEYDDKRHCYPRWNRVIRQALKDAQPQRKKGKWITVNGRLGNEVECNQCHSVFWYWMANYSFCPSCGARMGGDNL